MFSTSYLIVSLVDTGTGICNIRDRSGNLRGGGKIFNDKICKCNRALIRKFEGFEVLKILRKLPDVASTRKIFFLSQRLTIDSLVCGTAGRPGTVNLRHLRKN